MEKKTIRPMTPFDEMTVPAELQIVKLLLPYTPASRRQTLAVLIKYFELQHTLRFFQSKANVLQSQVFNPYPASIEEILDNISPYLPPEFATMLDTFRNVMNIMEMVKMFQEMSDLSGNADASSSGNSDENSQTDYSAPSPMNPTDILLGMLTPEQKEMLELYQAMLAETGSDGSDNPDTETGTQTALSSDTAAVPDANTAYDTNFTGKE